MRERLAGDTRRPTGRKHHDAIRTPAVSSSSKAVSCSSHVVACGVAGEAPGEPPAGDQSCRVDGDAGGVSDARGPAMPPSRTPGAIAVAARSGVGNVGSRPAARRRHRSP